MSTPDNRMYNNEEPDDSSCDSYCDSNCEEYVAEWDSEIESNGELYYIKSIPISAIESVSKPENTESSCVKKFDKKRTKRDKLSQFVLRRRNKDHKKYDANSANQNTSKVTFMESQEGEVKEIVLNIDSNCRRNLGRRSTLPECYLGITISTFADKSRIMIAGFIPDGPALKQRNIKIGDWLKCINGVPVNIDNVDNILSNIRLPAEVILLIQRVAACSVPDTETSPLQESSSSWIKEDNFISYGNLLEAPVAVLYLDMSTLNTAGNSDDRVYYCFPMPKEQNVIYSVRGAFLTLVHLMPKIVDGEPHSSSIIVKNEIVHVVYAVENTEIMLLAAPDTRCSCAELKQLKGIVARYLKFNFQTLTRCFTVKDHYAVLDKFFFKIFTQILNICKADNISDSPDCTVINNYIKYFAYPRWFSLPHEIQMKLDDILSELEANDFGDLGEDHYGCQRLYTIIGTCLYHRGYLIGTHLNREDQIDVDSYCYLEGLLNLTVTSVIHSLVIWREVFLSSNFVISDNKDPRKWFLLLVGQGQSILTVLMETGGCAVRVDGPRSPDELYVEQTQDILSHIHNTGFVDIMEKMLFSNTNPQLKSLSPISDTRSPSSWKSAESLLSFINSSTSSSGGKWSNEVTSILKHRGSLETNTFAYSLPTLSSSGMTEGDTSDSVSRTTSSIFSDDVAPVVGRRAQRMKQSLNQTGYSGPHYHSDSDHDTAGSSQFSLLSDTNITNSFFTPKKITSGDENVLFYYINMDTNAGIVIYPPDESGVTKDEKMHSILNCFRQSVKTIHSILNKTLQQKKQDTRQYSNYHIPVKEQGILFEYCCNKSESKKSSMHLTYWVVGRLFTKPSTREVYVCYEDKIPQNMVEIAFMLGLAA